MKKNIATSIFGQYGQNLYLNMRKDFKYAQRPQASFGRPKDPVAASGRLKTAFFPFFLVGKTAKKTLQNPTCCCHARGSVADSGALIMKIKT